MFSKVKFLLDRLLSVVLIFIFLPIMVCISAIILLDSRGRILFKQERTGKGGKVFRIYKFRTMVSHNDVHDTSQSDEYTRFGKLIRRFSLDELPQLFNIAIGQMSFIGPRPWIPQYYDYMTAEQRGRYDVRPGLTGMAQVMGRNHLTIFEKINYDLEYIQHYSFKQEVKILLLTVKTVFLGGGVNSGKENIHEELEELRKQAR